MTTIINNNPPVVVTPAATVELTIDITTPTPIEVSPAIATLDPTNEITLTLDHDARAMRVTSVTWDDDRVYGYGNKDGLFFVSQFIDNSGYPTVNGVFASYTKVFGARPVKNGDGNLDVFWATVTHNGPDEAGLFIGDVTGTAGGNLWGGHFRLTSTTTAANMRGLDIELIPNVDSTGKQLIGLKISNDGTYPASQGIRILGDFDRPIIIYDDSGGTTINFDLASDGLMRNRGHIHPMTSGDYDLGEVGYRWRNVYVNNLLVNGADGAAGAGNIAIKETALAPTSTPLNSGIIYVLNGALWYRGSAGTVTRLAVA